MALKLRHCAALLCAALSLQSCATTQVISDARHQFYEGNPNAAIEILNSESVSSRDELLLLLDKGLIAHTAGNYRESSLAFLRASSLLEQLNIVSVSQQSKSLVSNDWASTYKGELSELLWLHSFQMINFLMLGEPEGAAVEARQAIKLYNEYNDVLKFDHFTRALIALSLESVGDYDGAFIEYKKLFDDSNESPAVASIALTLAKRLGRENDANRFQKALATHYSNDTPTGQTGELVLFAQTGAIQPKEAGNLFISDDMFASFPIYPDYFTPNVHVDVTANNATIEPVAINVQLVDVSRRALADRGKRIAAKQVLRLAAKKALVDIAGKEGEAWGALMGALMVASEQADTRSWETLPAHFSMIRIRLPEGINDVRVQIHDANQTHDIVLHNVSIRARQRTYRSFRLGAGTPTAESPIQPAAAVKDAVVDEPA